MRRRALWLGFSLAGLIGMAGCSHERHQATTVGVNRSELASSQHLTVHTLAVGSNGSMQPEFTGSGAGKMPVITWSGIPPETREVEVLIEDPDAPGDEPYLHLLVEGIPPNQTTFPGPSGVLAKNSDGKEAYSPPNPPTGQYHHYHIEVIAVGARLGAKPMSREDLFKQMASHVVASGEVVGEFASS